MRLATVRVGGGEVLPVVGVSTGWAAVRDLLGESTGDVVACLPRLGELRELAEQYDGAVLPESGLVFLPPVPRPATFRDFYAFEAHVKNARARRRLAMEPAWYERPVFYFSNPVSLVGHEAEVFAPAGSVELDYELELGIVIGRGGRNIAQADAWEHIAGLTIVNDWSARDLQRQEMKVGLGPCKGKDFATAVGPWLVSPPPRQGLAMVARVNGRELSRGNSGDLHFPIERLVAEASRDAELLPGDLIGTGTVGTGCLLEIGGEWLKPGDVVELEIEQLGVLRNRIVPRPDESRR